MSDPPPMTMLLEGAVDAIANLKALRIGVQNFTTETDVRDGATRLIDTTIDELQYAVSAALDTKEAA